MALDPSIYGQIQPPPNPLAMAGQAVGIGNALAQNRLLQNENALFQARTAAGQLVGQSIDPQTGQFDPKRYNALVAGANLGPAAMEALQGGNTAAIGQNNAAITGQQLTQERIKTLQSHQNLLSQVLAPLTADPNSTKADVYKAASTLIANPDLDAETRKGLLGQSVQWLSNLSDDPKVMHGQLKGLQLAAQDAQARLAAATGQTQFVNTGGAIQPVNVNQFTGSTQNANGAPIPTTLSPAELADPVQVQRPDGSIETITRGEFLAKRAGAPGSPVPPGLPPGHVPEPVVTNVGPARTAALSGVGQGSGQMLNQDIEQGRTWQNDKAIYEEAIAHARTVKTGIGTQEIAAMKNFLGTMGVMSPKELSEAGEQQVLDKYLAQIRAAAPAWSGGTDLARNTAIEGTPSSKIPNQQLIEVLRMGEGIRAAQAARFRALKAQGVANNPEAYGAASADWAAKVDPRAFIFDKLSPPEKQQLKQEKQRSGGLKDFQDNLQTAHDLGFITLPTVK